jgi:hypothetical protein
VLPNRNLVSNIGFGPGATRTIRDRTVFPLAMLPTDPVEFPLVHPEHMTADAEADAFTGRTMFRGRRRRVARRLRGYLDAARQ